MTKFKRLLSSAVATMMVIGLLPTSVSATDIEEEINHEPMLASTHIGTTGTANTNILPPLQIAPFTLDGRVAYCMEIEKDFPVNLQYTRGTDYDSNPVIKAITYHGYPNNGSGLMATHGVTEEQARGMTQFAIWWNMTPGHLAPKSHPYLDELMALGTAQSYPTANFNLGTTSPNVSEYNGIQVSDPITTSGNYSGTFTFPSDSKVYSVDANGKWKKTFNIGETFKVVAVGSVQGNISRDISVSITEPSMEKYIPTDLSFQHFGVPSTKTTKQTKSLTVNFPGITLTGDIVVNKTDQGGNPLAGVEFGVYTDAGAANQVTTGITNGSGVVVFNGLNVGTTYYVKEITPLPGYLPDTNVKSVTVNGTVQSLDFVNTLIQGKIKVIKTETATTNRLQNAVFGVFNASGTKVANLTTNANGEAETGLLPYGTYTVRETQAPTGYEATNTEFTINITENNKTYTCNFENARIIGGIAIHKTDADNPNLSLDGVVFGVYNADTDAEITRITTGADGKASVSNLAYGRYYVKELSAKEGYVYDATKHSVNISNQGQVVNLPITNTKIKGGIKITKVEKGKPNEKLQGAEFTIYNNAGAVVETITTDVNGVATSSNLPYGEYTIEETKAPVGYFVSGVPIDVTINENNKIYEFIYDNDYIRGYIELHKKDAEDSSPLSGVKFGVYNAADDSLVQEIVTSGNGKIKTSELRYGSYYIQEIEAKEGYILDDTKYHVTITDNLKIYPKEVYNSKIKGDLSIKKVDGTTQEPLANVQFALKGLDSFNKNRVWDLTTDENGLATVSNLEYGTYELVEVRTLDGYILDTTPKTFKIDQNGQLVEIEVSNERIVGQLNFLKYDEETNVPLAGVEFAINCLAGFDKGNSFTFATDENGSYTNPNLQYGVYEIVEIKTQEGYVLNSDPIKFVISEPNEVVELSKANKKIYGKLQFNKADRLSQEVLNGAEIEIIGVSEMNKEVNIKFTSSEGGNEFILPYGSYEIKELNAPEGYLLTEEVISIEVVTDGSKIPVTLFNDKILGNVEIIKKSYEDNSLLQNAVFGLYNADGNLITKLTTDENGYASYENLEYGSYYIKELEAPMGYTLDETIQEFKIEEHDVTVSFEIFNRPLLALPDTSGINPMVIFLCGVVAVGASIFLLYPRREKHLR